MKEPFPSSQKIQLFNRVLLYRYTGRLAGDPINTLAQGEAYLFDEKAQQLVPAAPDWLKKSPLDLDDELWPEKYEKPPAPDEIRVEVKPSALFVLRP